MARKASRTVQEANGEAKAPPAAAGSVPPLRLEWRSPAELVENPRNWRRHPESQVSALTDTISEVGWAGACLFNERTGRLIDGHARRKVALEQGTEKVPVLVGDWSEADEAKILATLDPLAAMAEADGVRLGALLKEVSAGGAALTAMLEELAGKVSEQQIAALAAAPLQDEDDGEGAAGTPDSGYKQFSVPLTVAQESLVRRGVKEAKSAKGAETSGEALYFIVQEWLDARGA